MWHCWSPVLQEQGSSLGDVGHLGGNGQPVWLAPHGRAGKKELGTGEADFTILLQRSLCLFCCKVVAGLNWNCLSHELIQLLSSLQVHSMGWRSGGGGSWPQRRRMQPALLTPTPGQGVGWGGTRTPSPTEGEQAAPAISVLLGGLLPQLVSFGVAWVQPGEDQQFPVLSSWCFSPSRDFQL